MNKLFVEIFSDEKTIYTSIESFLVLYVYHYLKCPENTTVIYTKRPFSAKNERIKLNSNFIKANQVSLEEKANKVSHLKLPFYSHDNTYISGLCAVCRELVKQTENPFRKDLLGFKEGCLLSPAENSVWTKFCEIDITSAVNQILNFNFESLPTDYDYKIPEAISRFEAHMSQPVRIHNVYKVMQDQAKKVLEQDRENIINQGQNKKCKNSKHFDLIHKFAEGYFFTLADLILFPCFNLLFDILPHQQKLETQFPLIFKWINEVISHDNSAESLFYQLIGTTALSQTINNFFYIEEEFNKASLYKCDPKRYKPKDRAFTKQDNIEESLLKLSFLQLKISSENNQESENLFNWSMVKDDTFPNFGDIPQTRLERKKQQLENLASAVIALAKDNDLIVDFCSGSGHLGILLAIALPKCHIVLLENKARSLARAQQRVEQMKLENCSFYQSNIDYFEGPFDIGTSLHACGTATDIVLQHCIRNRAKFVCCPCCYGSINPMPHISYPLSEIYKTVLTERDYLFIAHAADQFHSVQKTPCNVEKCLQGEFCMDAIDTDRKIMAEEAGYSVILSRLKPENCTTKNRLIIGRI